MDFQEKRHFPRFNLQVDVSFKVKDKGCRQASTRNISLGGVCLISYQPLEEDDLLELEIFLPEEKKIKVEGRVAWTREFVIGTDQKGRRFDVGVEFVNADEKAVSELDNYIFKFKPEPAA